MRILLGIFLLALIIGAQAGMLQPALADDKPHIGFADGVAWTLTIKPEVYDKYLDFPTSQVAAVDKFAVYYQPMDGSRPVGDAVLYKNFYFDHGKAIGSKQVQDTNFPPQSQGQIIVKAGSGQTDAAAAASVAVRLFLALTADKAFPNPIIVDRNLFSGFIEGATRVGFSRLPQPPPKGLRPRAVLLVRSDVGGLSQLLMY
jgi:hypothetical protein